MSYIHYEFFNKPVEFVKGVGPQRADALRTVLNVRTIGELLQYFPFRYVDKTKFYKIKELTDEMPSVQIIGKFLKMETLGKIGSERVSAIFSDDSGDIELLWFQGAKWIKNKIKLNTDYIIFGKPTVFNSKLNITHPEIELLSERESSLVSSLQAVYPSSEKLKVKGFDSKGILRIMKNVVSDKEYKIEENLSHDIVSKLKLLDREVALKNIHFPENQEFLNAALKRLKFEELFFNQLQIARVKKLRDLNIKGIVFEKVGTFFNNYYHNYLPFQLTNAQKRVIREIREDVKSGKQMNRLLQGDVGSGKTLVAVFSMLLACDNGYQACMMVPTEILALQHYKKYISVFNELGLTMALLTGSTKKKEKTQILQHLHEGTLNIVVGTHALIEENVVFSKLGLAVIDEQHRFGVAQRATLWKKNAIPPHVLLMTATPIPRTLAMAFYGDLDVSTIDELPPTRKKILTFHKYDAERFKVYHFIRKQVAEGRQVYIVYPLIEESEKLDLENLNLGYEALLKEFPLPQYQISVVHGKQKPKDKEFEMERFEKGITQIMVSTTVIEVGVDVPNATLMVIESAERFGLSQLHQLRGRVGRGANESYCILLTKRALSNDAVKRIKTFCSSTDGFYLAQVDMELRGFGDMTGTIQSGKGYDGLADLAKDHHLLQTARYIADEIVNEDVNLELPKNKMMKEYAEKYYKDSIDWAEIS